MSSRSSGFKPKLPLNPFGDLDLLPRFVSINGLVSLAASPPSQRVILIIGVPSTRDLEPLLRSQQLSSSLVILASHHVPSLFHPQTLQSNLGSFQPAIRIIRLHTPSTDAVRLVTVLEHAQRLAQSWRKHPMRDFHELELVESPISKSSTEPVGAANLRPSASFKRSKSAPVPIPTPSSSSSSPRNPSRVSFSYSIRSTATNNTFATSKSWAGRRASSTPLFPRFRLPSALRRSSAAPALDLTRRPFDALLNFLPSDVPDKSLLKIAILVATISGPFLVDANINVLDGFSSGGIRPDVMPSSRRRKRQTASSIDTSSSAGLLSNNSRHSTETPSPSSPSPPTSRNAPSHILHLLPALPFASTTTERLITSIESFLLSFSQDNSPAAAAGGTTARATPYLMPARVLGEKVDGAEWTVGEIVLAGLLDGLAPGQGPDSKAAAADDERRAWIAGSESVVIASAPPPPPAPDPSPPTPPPAAVVAPGSSDTSPSPTASVGGSAANGLRPPHAGPFALAGRSRMKERGEDEDKVVLGYGLRVRHRSGLSRVDDADEDHHGHGHERARARGRGQGEDVIGSASSEDTDGPPTPPLMLIVPSSAAAGGGGGADKGKGKAREWGRTEDDGSARRSGQVSPVKSPATTPSPTTTTSPVESPISKFGRWRDGRAKLKSDAAAGTRLPGLPPPPPSPSTVTPSVHVRPKSKSDADKRPPDVALRAAAATVVAPVQRPAAPARSISDVGKGSQRGREREYSRASGPPPSRSRSEASRIAARERERERERRNGAATTASREKSDAGRSGRGHARAASASAAVAGGAAGGARAAHERERDSVLSSSNASDSARTNGGSKVDDGRNGERQHAPSRSKSDSNRARDKHAHARATEPGQEFGEGYPTRSKSDSGHGRAHMAASASAASEVTVRLVSPRSAPETDGGRMQDADYEHPLPAIPAPSQVTRTPSSSRAHRSNSAREHGSRTSSTPASQVDGKKKSGPDEPTASKPQEKRVRGLRHASRILLRTTKDGVPIATGLPGAAEVWKEWAEKTPAAQAASPPSSKRTDRRALDAELGEGSVGAGAHGAVGGIGRKGRKGDSLVSMSKSARSPWAPDSASSSRTASEESENHAAKVKGKDGKRLSKGGWWNMW